MTVLVSLCVGKVGVLGRVPGRATSVPKYANTLTDELNTGRRCDPV